MLRVFRATLRPSIQISNAVADPNQFLPLFPEERVLGDLLDRASALIRDAHRADGRHAGAPGLLFVKTADCLSPTSPPGIF
jgi:hypothetical protein